MTRESLVRERSSHLLYRLIRDDIGPCHEDAAGALRLMSHASLNLAAELGTDVVQRAGESLVWLALYAQWESGKINAVELGRALICRNILVYVPESLVQRRLARVEALRVSTVVARSPREADQKIVPSGQAEVDVLVDLHRLDRAMQKALACDDVGLMNRMFSDSGLLSVGLALASEDVDGRRQDDASARLVQLLGAGDVKRVAALEILAEIENGAFERIPAAFLQLSERSRRFELSLAQNMQAHGLLDAVRVGLGQGLACESSRLLTSDGVFAGDTDLAELAQVLTVMRGRCHGYFAGALNIESLKPWVMYLRNGCMNFAESRGLTLREATGFAHYCLHLVNICDLGGRGVRVVTEETRRALMEIEEDLKEFALLGQREGVRDSEVNLTDFERGRWKRRGDSGYLVDRLARLTGGWRAGVLPGPVGAPARLDKRVLDASQGLVDTIVVELNQAMPGSEQSALGMMAGVLGHCTIRGAALFEMLTVEEGFKVLSFGLAAARDSGGIDVNQSFELDLRGVLGGVGDLGASQDAGAVQLQRQMLAEVLKRRPLDAFFSALDEPGGAAVGLMSRIERGANDEVPVLVMSFEVDAELRSLLELLSHSSSQSVRLRTMLETRLDELLEMSFGEVEVESQSADSSTKNDTSQKGDVSSKDSGAPLR